VGPGRLLEELLGPGFRIVSTALCGDNTFAENPEAVAQQLVKLIAPCQPQVLVADPAFNSGRYGQSCAQVCVAVAQELKIPVLTGMYEENPGVEFRTRILIARTGPNARHMREALEAMAPLAGRLGRGEAITRPAESGCFARGLKRSVLREQNAACRAVDMVLAKVAGRPFKSEVSLPSFDRVEPVKLAVPLAQAKVALVTDGGLLVKGNPDRMPAGYTDRMTAVPIAGFDRLTPEQVEVYHGGFDNQFVNADPERLVPLETMRELERKGVIGKLNEIIYATAGLAMSLTNAKKVGQEMAKRLKADGVQAAILTST
jgi:glycine reductase